jgi:hypothetical protein
MTFTVTLAMIESVDISPQCQQIAPFCNHVCKMTLNNEIENEGVLSADQICSLIKNVAAEKVFYGGERHSLEHFLQHDTPRWRPKFEPPEEILTNFFWKWIHKTN